MGLFDSTAEEPKHKVRRYIITGVVFVALVAFGLWHIFRFHTEEETIVHFFTAVTTGNMQEAYRIWKPSQSYSFQDFLEDWGPDGYYGPVKSYRVASAEQPDSSNSVAVVVEISPYAPFPTKDAVKENKTKEVTLWVDRLDQSLSFPP